MFRNIFCAFLVALSPAVLSGQSLSISVEEPTKGNQSSEFYLQDGLINLGTTLTFNSSGKTITGFETYGLSPDLTLVGLLSIEGENRTATMLNAGGDTLTTYDVVDFRAGEQSLNFYPLNTGGSLIQNNIVNFNIYDSFGEILNNVSSASSSADGQVVSEVVMSADGTTITILTPTIKYGSQRGSRMQLLEPDMTLENIYLNRERTIKKAKISPNGQFLGLVTATDGEDDNILVIDRHGNELAKIQTSENIRDLSIADDGKYLTAYSSRRVVVYETLTGERQAGTSFSEEVLMARYFAEDETILALTGVLSNQGKMAEDLRFHAINVGSRQVARENFQAGPLGFHQVFPPYFSRSGSGHYQLRGGSKLLNISTSF